MKNKNNFNNLDKIIKEDYTNIAGIIISGNDKILYERYFNDYSKEDTIYIASVTKSILSILLGIAIDKGYITSVQQRVLAFFPEYKIKRGEKTIQNIRIQDLLTMTAPYKYRYEPYSKVYSSVDWTKAALDNVIYVCPKKGLVVAIAYTFKPRAKDRIDFIKRHILFEM